MSLRHIARNMPQPIGDHMVAWEERAIKACRNDPAVAAAGLCYVCMCSAPCLCQLDGVAARMREHFDTFGTAPRKADDGRSDPLMRDLLKVALFHLAESGNDRLRDAIRSAGLGHSLP